MKAAAVAGASSRWPVALLHHMEAIPIGVGLASIALSAVAASGAVLVLDRIYSRRWKIAYALDDRSKPRAAAAPQAGGPAAGAAKQPQRSQAWVDSPPTMPGQRDAAIGMQSTALPPPPLLPASPGAGMQAPVYTANVSKSPRSKGSKHQTAKGRADPAGGRVVRSAEGSQLSTFI